MALLGVAVDFVVGARYGPGAVEHGVSSSALAAAMAGVHLGYLRHLAFPFGLSLDYAVDPAGSWGDPAAWLGLLLLSRPSSPSPSRSGGGPSSGPSSRGSGSSASSLSTTSSPGRPS